MEEKKWINVEDVVAITGVSKSAAYKLMRQVNNNLKQQGKITVSGKVSRKKLLELIE